MPNHSPAVEGGANFGRDETCNEIIHAMMWGSVLHVVLYCKTRPICEATCKGGSWSLW